MRRASGLKLPEWQFQPGRRIIKREMNIIISDAPNTTTWYVKEVQASKGYKRKVGGTTIVIDETEEKVQESDH